MQLIMKTADSTNLPSDIAEMSEDEYQEWLCDVSNRQKAKPDPDTNKKTLWDKYGINCPFCGNKGSLLRWNRDTQQREAYNCECLNTVNSLLRLDRSGVVKNWQDKTFESYHDTEPWQQLMKSRIRKYVDDDARGWLLVTGQSGCGKTHLCTASFVSLAKMGYSCRYTRWVDIMGKLDAAYYNKDEYDRLLRPLQQCSVLYLDDLFKKRHGEEPTQKEFDHTYRLLDARYQNSDALTIISTEWTLEKIVDFDEALGGRIRERCGKHIVQIKREVGRNYRLKKYELI